MALGDRLQCCPAMRDGSIGCQCGYGAARDSHHYRVIQSLTLPIGAESKLVAQLEAFRKKRNIDDYERAGLVSTAEVNEMVTLAKNLRKCVWEWFYQYYPTLLKQ